MWQHRSGKNFAPTKIHDKNPKITDTGRLGDGSDKRQDDGRFGEHVLVGLILGTAGQSAVTSWRAD